MRLSRLALLLTGCALTVLASPVWSQNAPIVIEPPLTQPPVNEPLAPEDRPDPADRMPPLVIPAEPVLAPRDEPANPSIPAVWAPVPVDATGQSAYGLYLSGLLASLLASKPDR